MIVKNHTNYLAGMKVFSASLSFGIYIMFLRGIYTFRCYELVNMNRIPAPLRLLGASTVGYYAYSKLYKSHIYQR